MHRRGAPLVAAALLSVAVLLLVATLAALRSPVRTEALAAELSAEPVVQRLVADALAEQLLSEADERLDPILRLLLPVLGPAIEQFIRTSVASAPGQAALASALTDTIRQATLRGPTVIDLRAAVDASLAVAPTELTPILRTLLEGREAGLLVIGTDERAHGDVSPVRRPVEPGTVAGVPSVVAVTSVALLAAALLVAVGSRRAGVTLLVVALPTALALWVTPELLTGLLARNLPDEGGLGALVPVVADGLSSLLAPVRLLASLLALAGAGLSVLSRLGED